MHQKHLFKLTSVLLVLVLLFTAIAIPATAETTLTVESSTTPQSLDESPAGSSISPDTQIEDSSPTVAASSSPEAQSTDTPSGSDISIPPDKQDQDSLSTTDPLIPVNSQAISQLTSQSKELPEFRTANTDRYKNPDGTYTVKMYIDPVNYKDSRTGKWQKIDSSLSKRSDSTYHNKANSFDISLPSKANNGAVSVTKDGQTVSFLPLFAEDIQGIADKNDINYKNVALNTDLSYSSSADGLKESIILNSTNAPTSFDFKMNLHGLSYKEQPDSSVAFYKTGTEDLVFTMPAPFMTDAKGETSTDVSYTFKKDNAGNTILEVIADSAWIQDENRVFPIVIDPSVYNDSIVGTTMISQSHPDTNYNNYQHIYVGGASQSFGIARSMFWFYLPTLPTGAVVTSATLNVDNTNKYTTGQSPVIAAHRITANWQSSTVNWSNQPGITASADETYTASNQTTPYIWQIPITSIVKSWYSGESSNFGIELKYANESLSSRELLSSADTSDPANHPYVTINYSLDGAGAEPYWTFSGPVNMVNMNLVLPATDIAFPGRNLTIPLDRTYNSRPYTQGVFGNGWSSALDSKLYGSPGQIVSVMGSSGTTYTFNRIYDGEYDVPEGLHWNLNITADTATITTVDKTVYTYKLQSARVYRLSSIRDAQGNTLTYEYTNNKVTEIHDNAGHTIQLIYNSNNLVETATDPSGKIWTYYYDSNKNLTSIKFPDNTSEQYRYDSHNKLIAYVSPEGNIIHYGYTIDPSDSSSYRLASINPLNMVSNGNMEVSSGGNNRPDRFYYFGGYNTGAISTTDWTPFGPTSFKISSSSTNPSNYTVFMSDSINVNPNTAYTLSGYLRGAQNSGALQTVLSMYAYDTNGTSLGEVGRIAVNGTFSFQRYSATLNPANGTGLPSGTATVKIRMATSSTGGSGTSWWDGIQLEEGTTLTAFTSGNLFNYSPANKLTASYDGDGRKQLYTYDDNQNLTKYQIDPNGLNLSEITSWENNRLISYKDPAGSTWTYTNTSSGLLESSKNPQNKDELYFYDNNGNMTGATLINHATVNATYDSSNNQLTARDPFDTSVASTYDADNGNLISTSVPVGASDNLLDNSSFEQGPQSDGITPTHFSYAGGQTGWWAIRTNYFKSGKSSFTIAAQGGTSQPSYSSLLSDLVNIESSKDYLLSGYLMATQSNGLQKTVLSVHAYSSANSFLGEIGRMELNGTSSWQRWSTVIRSQDIPQGTAKFRVKVAGLNETGYGNSYFDDIQLQKNAVSTVYNLLDNSNFERGASWPDYWTHSTATDSWADIAYTGGRSVSISNATAETGIAYSNYWPYNPEKTYTLTAFVKTSGLALDGGYIEIVKYDSNKNPIEHVYSKKVGGTKDWQMLTVTLPVNQTGTVYIAPKLNLKSGGTIYFDNVSLLEGGTVLSQIQYDSNKTWVESTTDPMGNVTQYNQYDSSGNLLRKTDPLGLATDYTYNLSNQVTSVTPPQNSPAQDIMFNYEYDDDGNLKTVSATDKSKTTTYSSVSAAYTKTGQLSSYTDPLNKQTTYQYTPGGQLQKITMPSGDTITDAYDMAGRLTSISYNGTQRYVLGYDANSNLTTIQDTALNVTWTVGYDELNRMRSWTNGTHTITYTPDDSGNITQKSLKTGAVTTQAQTSTYNLLNQLTTLTDAGGSLNKFLYDQNGALSTLQAGNGVTTNIDYDINGRITKVVARTKTGTIIDSNTFTYDADGFITSVTDKTGLMLNYTYYPQGQLKTETLPSGNTMTYTYDVLGNMTQKQETTPSGTVVSTVVYTIDPVSNRLQQVDGRSYTYDDNGNETSNGIVSYKWDEAGRMIEVDNASGSPIALYKYDSLNRMVQKTAGGVTINYLYDGTTNRVLAEYDGSGNQTKYYTWGPDGLLAITVNGNTYYAVHNGHGDITALTDATGNVVVTYKYDTWGNLTGSTDTSGIGLKDLNPYRYAGYRYDSDSGLYYLMARWYDASTGRFISQDSEALTLSRYIYCANNPIMYVDPNGKIFENVGKIVKNTVVGIGAGIADFVVSAERTLLYEPLAAATDLVGWHQASNFIRRNVSQASDTMNVLIDGMVTDQSIYRNAKAGTDLAITVYGVYGLAKSVTNVYGKAASAVEGGMCFTSDTLILTKEGYKEIKDVKVGEEVYSENTNTGETGLKKVKNVFINETCELIHVYAGKEEIKTTPSHPFWVEGTGWVDAGELNTGDKLSLFGGSIIEISRIEIEKLDEAIKVYNFEVEDWHTYFVSNTEVLVHNMCAIKNTFKSIKDSPKYPKGFKEIKNGTKKVNMNNGSLLDELRKIQPGEWKKVYKNGYNEFGNAISIHYHQHTKTGIVFDVKVKDSWSTW